MTKFKIIRNIRLEDEETVSDTVYIEEQDPFCFFSPPTYSSYGNNFSVDTKDLPDLIKALQDKEKEINK